MANNLREIKLLISKYWQGVVTAVTAVFTLSKVYYDYSKGSSLDAIRLGNCALALKLCDKLSNIYKYPNLLEIAGVLTSK
ncbi:hypothetical protein [Niastella sp. OAS944]|uniref:hypothetical protein n=1 Tax=Niastella sp. OAS944 TaxID=2664089 RepID=UPI00348C474E|nr:tRNA A37 threonylcarbamoyladenosine synthetase subunit TsaC/SUA5/YrdC [Chitinophagaceae bacterium OAS944]